MTVYVGSELVGTVNYEAGKTVYEFPGLDMNATEITIYGGGNETLTLAEVEVYGKLSNFSK